MSDIPEPTTECLDAMRSAGVTEMQILEWYGSRALRKTPIRKAIATKLYDNGMTASKISDLMGLSPQTVYDYFSRDAARRRDWIRRQNSLKKPDPTLNVDKTGWDTDVGEPWIIDRTLPPPSIKNGGKVKSMGREPGGRHEPQDWR